MELLTVLIFIVYTVLVFRLGMSWQAHDIKWKLDKYGKVVVRDGDFSKYKLIGKCLDF